MLGETVSHYRILEKLGQGGMGEVYLARDTKLRRDVALKVLRSTSNVPRARKLFRREAEALARLNHPNIATIHDFDVADDVDYLVMEFVPGETLSDIMREGLVPQDEILRIAEQVSDGLRAAHESGLVHRDLKPANLRITPDGRVKILDFGLARILYTGPVTDLATTQTAPGVVMGTVPYMSPEQIRGQPADTRSDVYSTGVVLYEMATGQRPHQARDAAGLMASILNDPPVPPSQVQFGIDADLESIILKMLEKDPDRRYRDAAEFQTDLLRVRDGLGAKERVAHRRRRRNRAAVALTPLLLLALAVALDVGGLQRRLVDLLSPGPPPIRSMAVLPFVNLSEPEEQILADGLTQDLITSLQRLGALERVTSPRVSMAFRDSNEDPVVIAKRLGVDAVAEGSYQQTGDQVKVNVRVIHAGPNVDLWAGSFQRSLRDVLALHGEIARAIADQIEAALTPEEEALLRTAREIDPSALREYLAGRSLFWDGTAAAFRKALPHFDAAIAIDSTYAEAYAARSIAQSWLLAQNGVERDSVRTTAWQDAERALQLDSDLAEAHAALANAHFWIDFEVGEAEAAFQRAFELDPTNPRVAFLASFFWYFIGQEAKAIEEGRRALLRSPMDPSLSRNLAWLYYVTGQHKEAIAQHEETFRILEIMPNEKEEAWAHAQIAWNLFHLNRLDELKAKVVRGEYAFSTWDSCVVALARGDSVTARDIVDSERLGSGETEWQIVAKAHLGDVEPFFAMIERFHRQKSSRLVWNIRGPELPELVSRDPRHAEWLERLGLVR